MISTISSNSSPAAAGGTDPTDFIKKMFAKTDTDGDGKITQDEFVTTLEKRLGKTSADTNAPDPVEIFKKVDSDSDGSITASEFESAFKTMKSQGKSQGGTPPPPPSGPPPSGGGDDSSEVYDVRDTNKDGTVSIEELVAALTSEKADKSGNAISTADLQSLFDRIDSDDDGAVTESEFKTMLEKMQENRPPPPDATYALDGSASASSSSAGVFLHKQG